LAAHDWTVFALRLRPHVGHRRGRWKVRQWRIICVLKNLHRLFARGCAAGLGGINQRLRLRCAGKNRLQAKKMTARTTQNRRNAPAGVLKKLMALRDLSSSSSFGFGSTDSADAGATGGTGSTVCASRITKKSFLMDISLRPPLGVPGDGKILPGLPRGAAQRRWHR